MQLFLSFDSSSVFGMNLNWFGSLLIIFWFSGYWLIPSVFIGGLKLLNSYLVSEMLVLFGKGVSILEFISLFFYIFILNFFGLFPYIFSLTSHLSLTFFLGFPLWLGGQMYGWIMNTNEMFSHLVPEGSPSFLMFFLVVVEFISVMIRPLTLSVRLFANITAGHVLLVLIGSMVSCSGIMISCMVMLFMNMFIFLELGVSLIQSYVYMLLSSLYGKELEF